MYIVQTHVCCDLCVDSYLTTHLHVHNASKTQARHATSGMTPPSWCRATVAARRTLSTCVNLSKSSTVGRQAVLILTEVSARPCDVLA